METTSEAVILWGSDHVDLGTIEVSALTHRAALAISKGKEPKGYPHTDPNEDAVAGVAGERGILLVCADGHNGFESVPIVVNMMLDRFGRDPSPEAISEADLLAAFRQAHQTLLDRLDRPDCTNRESRTTLIAAVVGSKVLRWAAMGDSALFVAGPTNVERMDESRHRFMGHTKMSLERVADALHTGTAELHPGSWIVLATDGFLDFAPGSPEDAIWRASETAYTPTSLARELVVQAFNGNAADNVAVAVAGPTG